MQRSEKSTSLAKHWVQEVSIVCALKHSLQQANYAVHSAPVLDLGIVQVKRQQCSPHACPVVSFVNLGCILEICNVQLHRQYVHSAACAHTLAAI